MSIHPPPHRTTLAMLIAAVACVLASATAAQAAPAARLVNAQWTSRSDSLGMLWDLQPGGYINNGTNNAFNNAMLLQINGSNLNATGHRMTPDGTHYVIDGNQNGVQVQRHIYLNPKFPGVCYVDTFTNPQSNPLTITAGYYVRLSSQAQQVITDTGKPLAGQLPKKSSGIYIHRQGSQPSVILALRTPDAKIQPMIQNQHNYHFVIQYPLQIPAGKSVTLVAGIGQRQLNAAPTSGPALEKLFAPFRSQKFLKDVPHDLLRQALNWSGGQFGQGDPPALITIARDLKLDRPTAHDLLAISETTRLRGKATWTDLSVKTAHGLHEPAADAVAAIAGPRYAGEHARLYLKDGQILAGTLAMQGLEFALTGGAGLTLNVDRLDRIILESPDADAAGTDAPPAMLDTFRGDRLILEPSASQLIAVTAVTPFGRREIPMEELRWVQARTEKRPGYEFVLRDGSRFFGMLDSQAMTVHTRLFGPISISPTQIRYLATDLVTGAEDQERADDDRPPMQSHMTLANGQLIVGELDLDPLELLTVSGPIRLPASQVRSIRQPEEDGGHPGTVGPVLEVTLWDGSKAAGRFQQPTIAVNADSTVWQIPAKQLRDYLVPVPRIDEQTQARMVLLIRELGSDDWRKREEATEKLVELGPLAHAKLELAAQTTRDPEVRRRVEAILDQMPESLP